MSKVKFDAKSFLGLKTLSPLEERGIKGGLADYVRNIQTKKRIFLAINVKVILNLRPPPCYYLKYFLYVCVVVASFVL